MKQTQPILLQRQIIACITATEAREEGHNEPSTTYTTTADAQEESSISDEGRIEVNPTYNAATENEEENSNTEQGQENTNALNTFTVPQRQVPASQQVVRRVVPAPFNPMS